jgi:hypothetical protein
MLFLAPVAARGGPSARPLLHTGCLDMHASRHKSAVLERHVGCPCVWGAGSTYWACARGRKHTPVACALQQKGPRPAAGSSLQAQQPHHHQGSRRYAHRCHIRPRDRLMHHLVRTTASTPRAASRPPHTARRLRQTCCWRLRPQHPSDILDWTGGWGAARPCPQTPLHNTPHAVKLLRESLPRQATHTHTHSAGPKVEASAQCPLAGDTPGSVSCCHDPWQVMAAQQLGTQAAAQLPHARRASAAQHTRQICGALRRPVLAGSECVQACMQGHCEQCWAPPTHTPRMRGGVLVRTQPNGTCSSRAHRRCPHSF